MKNLRPYMPSLLASGVIAIYSLGVAIAVYNHDMTFETTSKSQIWSQPENVEITYEISPYTFKIDFERVEKILSKLPIDKNGNILLNPQAAKLLKQASDYISKNVNAAHTDRAYWLIDRIHPQNQTKQLSHLVSNYQAYLLARENQKKTQMTSKEKLYQSIKLKEQYFGINISKALFGEKHKLARYIIDRQEILESRELSSSEKQEKLLTLKNQLK